MNVYKIYSKSAYAGYSLVGAHSAEEANAFIRKFKYDDATNINDSWGYEYVVEDDIIEGLNADYPGIIHMGIYYTG